MNSLRLLIPAVAMTMLLSLASGQTAGNTPGSNELVQVVGGTLPSWSELAGQRVRTFYIGKTETTWGEWQGVRAWALTHGYEDLAAGKGTGTNHPVSKVNWHDVVKWCNARSQQEGLRPVYLVGGVVYKMGNGIPLVDEEANGFRLPSENEWEYAARGGVKASGPEAPKYSGSDDVKAVAWYGGNAGRTTHEVGTKQANELGIYDMSGNVKEWCFDTWFPRQERVARGGDWHAEAVYCSVAFRGYCRPAGTDNTIGFRVVRSSLRYQ